jgi:hypothetical protein
MARSNKAALAVLAIGTFAALAGAALALDRSVTVDRTAANASAHNGDVVWSRVGRDGRSRLVERRFGREVDTRAKPKDGLFDPDLGTNRRGNRVIVYTRCAGLTGRDCDVWELDYSRTSRGRERKLPGASSSRCSEFAPSIWIGSVAFARSGPGECNGLFVLRRGHRERLDKRVPADTDLRGRRVAYLYVPAGDPSRTFIRIRSRHRGKSRLLVAGFTGRGEGFRVTSPVLDGAFVYWLQHDLRRKEFFVGRGRVTRASSVEFSDRTLPGRPDSIAVTRGLLFYTNGRGLLQATDPAPGFAAAG